MKVKPGIKFAPCLSQADCVFSVRGPVKLFQLCLINKLRGEVDLHADDAHIFRPLPIFTAVANVIGWGGRVAVQQVVTHDDDSYVGVGVKNFS